jgi:hypothetical protein
MGFLDKLLGRDKEPDDMPAEPQMRSEGTQPETTGMAEPPPAPAPPADMPQEPGMGTEGTPPPPPPERNEP